MTIVAVLALGANQYKSLVERDNNAYNKRIITSYVSAQIRGYDRADAVKVGGFASPDVDDEVNTLHLLETIDGIRYDLKIYYYQGKVYELFAAFGIDLVWLISAKGKLASLAHPLQFFLLLFLCGIFLLTSCFGALRYSGAKKRENYLAEHTLLCPTCGKRISTDCAFCPACGKPLDKDPESTSDK